MSLIWIQNTKYSDSEETKSGVWNSADARIVLTSVADVQTTKGSKCPT